MKQECESVGRVSRCSGVGLVVWPVVLAHASGGEAPHWIVRLLVEGVAMAIVAVTLYLAIRYLVWPGEGEADHIKRQVLDGEEL
jgi:hypothetical protein